MGRVKQAADQYEVSGPTPISVRADGHHLAQPLFLADPISTAAFSIGGGLVLTGASGATLATVPTASILLGKALLAKKAILLKAYLDSQNQRGGSRRGH